MNIFAVNSGYFKLDGGAMFGVVPKTIWQKLVEADQDNLCNWAMRCMVISQGNRVVLIDTGLGDKQEPKFFSHYKPTATNDLQLNLKKLGLTVNDITDVVLTHLHFDHCGGAVKWNKAKDAFETVFPNATYWSHSEHMKHALNSNPREKASFLIENIQPLIQNQCIKYLDKEDFDLNGFDFLTVDGHTEKMILPLLEYKNKKVLYCADLIPSVAHLPVNFVMGYDIRPLITMKEKQNILEIAAKNEYVLFFEHDAVNEACTIVCNERGRFIPLEIMRLSEV